MSAEKNENLLYHVTEIDNVPFILREGLLRCHGDHRSAFVSLSEDPESWIKDGLALLSVDVKGLNCPMSTFAPELDEIEVWGDIPPDRIKRIK